jgi:predicted DCC family thiol-disulfide oxidoreductase YuxK
MNLPNTILIFDGDCMLCNRSVMFLKRLKRDAPLHYVSNNSEEGRRVISNYCVTADPGSTLILLHRGKIFLRSAAVREALWLCGIKGKLLSAPLMLLPTSLLDPLYRLIARHRKRIGGTACKLPK